MVILSPPPPPPSSGLVPIMIGHKAVDPVTGDLSPVTGVRISADTGTVVPVTLAGGGNKKKPPLGAVSIIPSSKVPIFPFSKMPNLCSLVFQNFKFCDLW